ncbi:MAG: DUF6285 domain-containing protein [Acidiferrobacterales bacterium]
MPDHPTGAELLRAARETLLNELLAQLPAEQKYPAIMVASAMGIAVREAEIGSAILDIELDLFAQLYGEQSTAQADAEPLAALRARLADEIRCGKFDGEPGDRLRPMLLEWVCARLRVSNPKHLKAAGFGDE